MEKQKELRLRLVGGTLIQGARNSDLNEKVRFLRRPRVVDRHVVWDEVDHESESVLVASLFQSLRNSRFSLLNAIPYHLNQIQDSHYLMQYHII